MYTLLLHMYMYTLKLRYIIGSREAGASFGPGIDLRMWDIIQPKLKGYNYKVGYPTFTLESLQNMGLVPK